MTLPTRKSDAEKFENYMWASLPVFAGYAQKIIDERKLPDSVREWDMHYFESEISKYCNPVKTIFAHEGYSIRYWFRTKNNNIVSQGIMLDPGMSFVGLNKEAWKTVYCAEEDREYEQPEDYWSRILPFCFEFNGNHVAYVHEIRWCENIKSLSVIYCSSKNKKSGQAHPILRRSIQLSHSQQEMIYDHIATWNSVEDTQWYDSEYFGYAEKINV